MKQLDVIEPHGILLFRCATSRVYVFRLQQLESPGPMSRADIKEHRLERARGCHVYALSRPGGSRLRMCAAVARRLLLFQWKHSAAWTAWCPTSDNDTVDGFTFLWVSTLTHKKLNYVATILFLTFNCYFLFDS